MPLTLLPSLSSYWTVFSSLDMRVYVWSITLCYAMFSCYLWEVSSFLKGNGWTENVGSREEGILRHWQAPVEKSLAIEDYWKKPSQFCLRDMIADMLPLLKYITPIHVSCDQYEWNWESYDKNTIMLIIAIKRTRSHLEYKLLGLWRNGRNNVEWITSKSIVYM